MHKARQGISDPRERTGNPQGTRVWDENLPRVRFRATLSVGAGLVLGFGFKFLLRRNNGTHGESRRSQRSHRARIGTHIVAFATYVNKNEMTLLVWL